jgi:hypothetical protein
MVDPIVVDDRDPRMQYVGDWWLGGRPEELDQTTTGTGTAGAVASFKFFGEQAQESFILFQFLTQGSQVFLLEYTVPFLKQVSPRTHLYQRAA